MKKFFMGVCLVSTRKRRKRAPRRQTWQDKNDINWLLGYFDHRGLEEALVPGKEAPHTHTQ